MPPISFNQIPANARVPLIYIEFDSTRAGATGMPFRDVNDRPEVGDRGSGRAYSQGSE